MSSKKYYIDFKKIYIVEKFKESIIALEYDIIKIYQNLKRIIWEIIYLYNIIIFKKFKKSEESNSNYTLCKTDPLWIASNNPKKKIYKIKYVKKKFINKKVKSKRNLIQTVWFN